MNLENSTTEYGSGDLSIPSQPSINTTDTVFRVPFDETTATASIATIYVMLVFSFLGNVLSILVIATSKKLGGIFDMFILSLCVSDLFSTLISWINIHRRTTWFDTFHEEMPNFFCVLYWGGDIWTSYVTSLHILTFAILRLISVWKPVLFNKIKLIHAKICIGVMWLVTFACGFVPFAYLRSAKKRDRSGTSSVANWPSCTQNHETLADYKAYQSVAFPIFFYIPLVGIVIASAGIGVVLCSRKVIGQSASTDKSPRTKRKEQQAILQLALIVLSFMIGYVPFTVFEFYTVTSSNRTYDERKLNWLLGTLQYILLRFSECLNPIFYNVASTKMRLETKKFLKRYVCMCCKCEVDNQSNSVEMSSTPSSGNKL